jgi:hypothetical protein
VITEPREQSYSPTRHRGYCGRRVFCWRDDCRREFAGYRTIEILANVAMARCHEPAIVQLDDPRLRAVAA